MRFLALAFDFGWVKVKDFHVYFSGFHGCFIFFSLVWSILGVRIALFSSHHSYLLATNLVSRSWGSFISLWINFIKMFMKATW